MDNFFTFSNRGQAILETNYWDSERAQKGLAFLSWNAGAARLLVPDSLKPAIKEMKTAKYVIISREKWTDQNNRDGLEILFEDNSPSPYCLHITAEQSDRTLLALDQGGGFVVTVWTKGGEKLRLPGKYREVESIPYLKFWESH